MMRMAMRLPPKSEATGAANDVDPRDESEAEIIDLASRNAYPAVAAKKGKTEGLGMVAGIALRPCLHRSNRFPKAWLYRKPR